MNRANPHFLMATKSFFAACLLAFALSAPAADQYPPGKLTFQGYLTDATGTPLGLNATASAQVQFRLWRSATGAAPADIIWAEQQVVKVNRGFFTALLGAGNATGVAGEFFTNSLAGLFLGADASDRFLGVTVVGQGGEISPRIQFLSSPFAHLARSTAALLNDAGQPIVATAPGAVGVNLGGAAPGATLDVLGTVKATTFTGDGSALTGIVVNAANVTGTFDASRIVDGSISGAKFATNTIGAAQIASGAVTAAKLGPDAALALAAAAGGVGNGGVIVSSNKVDAVLHNMGYVNIGKASFDGPKWTIRATKDTPNAPVSRINSVGSSDHRAAATIWTGSKWIMYSGDSIVGGYATDGGIFDPALNSWTPISLVGAPVARNEINFIWTGTRGIFWGGHDGAPLAAGALYDPASNTWSPMSTTNQPAARNRHRSVWTGTEMFVWGGEINNNINAQYADGKLYNPATDTWRNVAAAPIAGRRDFNCFWTGSEVLIWGGVAASTRMNDGAFYNPASNTWRLMSSVNAPTPREAGMGVFTGREFIVWGGNSTTSLANSDGGRYDVAGDTWIPFFTPNIRFFFEGAAFWNGSKVYFVQGQDGAVYVNDGGVSSGWSFDPSNNKWDYLPAAPLTQSWMPHAWTGTELLTFATFRDGNDRTVLSFKPETETYFYAKTPSTADQWQIRATKDTPNAPLPRVFDYSGTPHRSVWTGSKWLVWGGSAVPHANPYTTLNAGAAFDPSTSTWQLMATTNAPSPRSLFSVVWTGDQAIYWGGYTNNVIGDGKRYFPANNTWSNITATGAPSARCRHSTVWTGTEMLVWGGQRNNVTTQTVTNNGARYNPATDTWTAMATPPAGITNRCDHVAVWTGTEMIIWGGSTDSNPALAATNNGARYNPTSDTWTPMSSVNAPIGRALALAVWTGTEMIVWGGYLGLTNSNTGGRYNPATDTWTPFNTGQYTWSQEATAVWTGSKVIWAGGVNNVGMVNRSGKGGITYDPATGIVGILPVAPIQQRNMPYTWTGTQLLTFGSWEDFTDRTVLSYQP